jgi:RNA recognition motif-containing protein
MKVAQTLSLDKSKQRAVANKAKRLRRRIKSGKITIREDIRERKQKVEQLRGLVYVGHLPHGFYEEEIKGYFKQFGRVTNAKVCRSKKTGNSKGYGYVEFAYDDVAKVAAETMNNYLMFKKKIIAEHVPYEKRPKSIFHGHQSMPKKFTRLRRWNRNVSCKNKKIDDETHLSQSKSRLTRLQKRLQKINGYGISYDLKPVDVPKSLKKQPVGVPKSLKK